MKIKFIEYNGIEGYIELMKRDVEPLNDPNCKNIELYYEGKDIKAVLDYITNLQQENERLKQTQYVWSYDLDMQLEDYKSRCKKSIEYINSFNVFERFSFPLMKKWEENQIKSSIDYEFNSSLKNDLLNILGGDKE